ncbi:hypothetical protein [Kutzneria buriramensis]|uniref:AbiTii domain-containing protein n=1 Tax=Kutzneria buriramensis TaxID=1045776 RepID=UPI000E243033|nr:hypothetical protein [Kutzneria buriramensis]
MGFLDKLIHAVRRNSSTADVLRAIHALAERIDSPELAGWADHELFGYAEEDPVPPYRGPFPAEVRLRHRGRSGAMAELPRTAFAEELRQSKLMRLYELTVLEPVEHLEELVRAGDKLVRPWGAVHVDLLNQLIEIGGLTVAPVAAAENRLDHGVVGKIVDAVRNRVLGLALSLEQVAPDAGDKDGPSSVTPAMEEIIARTIGSSDPRRPADL